MSATYKVTALKDVTFLANVRTRAGQIRDGLGLVFEVHPKHGLSLQEQGALDSELPKEIGGLYRLEISSTST